MAGKVTPLVLRDAIADVLAENVKAYNLAEVCVALGLEGQRDEYDSPSSSKRVYVRARILTKPMPELVDLGRRLVEEYDDDKLRALLDRIGGAHGVMGDLKNIIFAADGPKPRLVLRDAINNEIEIVENAEFCLIYDRPLPTQGLTWRQLVEWWTEAHGDAALGERENALSLWSRLDRSLGDNGVERAIFKSYAKRYGGAVGFELPALLPQVYLHYDPYTKRQLGSQAGPLKRQRMDFLLLLPDGNRAVIEVDGVQHYSTPDRTQPSPAAYAEMVAEDRRLRLAGYEVYRFGGHELASADASAKVDTFFDDLLKRHKVGD